MKKSYLVALIILIFFIFIFLFFNFFVIEEEIILFPKFGKDSDGSLSDEIVENIKKGYERVILKFYPYGFLEVWGWENQFFVKKIFAVVEWRADEDLGAGNIFIGYSLDGKNYYEIGPLNASNNYTKTIIEIPIKTFSNIENIKIRFRGEDLDYAIDAYAEVKIYLKVIRYKFRLY